MFCFLPFSPKKLSGIFLLAGRHESRCPPTRNSKLINHVHTSTSGTIRTLSQPGFLSFSLIKHICLHILTENSQTSVYSAQDCSGTVDKSEARSLKKWSLPTFSTNWIRKVIKKGIYWHQICPSFAFSCTSVSACSCKNKQACSEHSMFWNHTLAVKKHSCFSPGNNVSVYGRPEIWLRWVYSRGSWKFTYKTLACVCVCECALQSSRQMWQKQFLAPYLTTCCNLMRVHSLVFLLLLAPLVPKICSVKIWNSWIC